MKSNLNSLKQDEDRKATQHETVKGELREQVHDEIKQRADIDEHEKAEIESVAHELKHKAIHEVSTTEQEVTRARQFARISQVVDYLFGLVYGLLALLIALELLGARQGSGFKQFLDTVTYPLVAPFRGLMPDPRVGNFQLMLSYVIGLIVYALIHFAIKGLIRLMAQRPTVI
ncbi:MAG: hypothetical protein DMG11_13890 [Acidobacteria bacterium]|nr:MAG: hypothetical protein DMG11_13890 [Acidobacteriota bacterium]